MINFQWLIQQIPRFPGKMRMVRIMFRKTISSAQNITIKGHNRLIFSLPNLKESIGQEILGNGVYEPEIINLITKHLQKGEVLLDIGANVGAICIPVANECKNSQVFAIEASANIYAYLKRNVQANGLENINPVQVALSQENDMQLPFYSPSEKYGKGSFSPVFTSDAEMVSTCTLDSFVEKYAIKNVSIIKVDVEGYEYHIFKGGENLLITPQAPKIIFEFVDWAEREAEGVSPGMAQRLLINYGYQLYQIQGVGRSYKLNLMEEVATGGSRMILAMKRNNKN